MSEKMFLKKFEWTRENTLHLIEIWEQFPILYDSRNRLYHNKHARYDALSKITEAMAPQIKDVNIEEIKSKLSNLRSQYNHELQKQRKGGRSGAGADEVFETIYWFEKMNFIKKFIKPRKGKSNTEEELTQAMENDGIDSGDCTENSILMSPPKKIKRIEEVKEKPSASSQPQTTKEDSILFEASEAIKIVSASMQNKNIYTQDVETFGEYIKAELNKIKNHVRDFSCGKLYYKTFYFDEDNNAVYVGAMDRVFRLNLQNISQSVCERDVIILEPTGSDILNCVSKGKRELFECRNHIRVIQPMNDGRRLYICGTNAHNPKDYVIFSNLTHLPRSEYVPGIGLGIAKCPYDPLDNSTAVFVEKGNPGNLPALYSGTNAEFTKADSVIFRSDLYNLTSGRKEHNFKRTLKYDSKWLDKPNFVGSYDIGEYVYFFFRERAVEYINCGKAIYSRIARVCKNDKGGKYMISQNWATYLKARINCSISSEFPFYFNEIQGVYKMPKDDTKFYATFTTNTHGIVGSAICSYDIRDINAAFEGKFKEQATSNSAWLPVLNSKVPEPRPGSCTNDTSSLPDSVLNFIRKHPLMDQAVHHEYANPVFYKRDVILTKLVVDKIRIDKLNHEYLVYFVGTNTGSIYKIVQFIKFGQQRMSSLLDILEIAKNEPIREMEISQKTSSLYIATDHSVKQIDLAMCNRRYDSCFRCVKDPYCGWDKDSSACKPYQLGLLQDVGNETSGICDTSVLKKRITASYGQTLHLSCFVRLPEVLRQKSIRWFHHSTEKGRYEINYSPSKYIETSEGGLVIISINEGDGGRYDNYLDGTLLCSYSVTVDAHRCTPPTKKNDYQKIYSHWCNEFEKYKSAMKQWQEKQEHCSAKDKKDKHSINDVTPADKTV